ncbi:hypothetical protein GGG16DRAFT_53106 [Schizophyllum commune]
MSIIEAGYPGPSLLVLPLDVLIVVQSFMKPLDIMVLQSTCKALRDPTLRRTVWRDALRRVIEENDVFAPTFPSLQTMSISELSYAALRPQVFLQRVRRCASSCPEGTIGYLEPLRRHEVQLNMRDIDEDTYADQYGPASLVSGGRYLVVMAAYFVYIYDLRQIRPHFDPILAISVEDLGPLPGSLNRKWYLELHIARGGDLFLFISFHTETEPEEKCWTSVMVYKIQGLPNAPRGEVIARLHFPFKGMLDLHSVEGDRVAFSVAFSVGFDKSPVGVWDLARNEMASWIYPFVHKCIIANNGLCVVTGKWGLFLYDIPPLEPIATDQLNESVLMPNYIFPPPENMRLHGAAIYQRSEDAPLFHVRYGEADLVADIVMRYRVVPPPSNSAGDPAMLVMESIRDFISEGPGRRSALLHTLRRCDDSIVDARREESCYYSASKDRTRATIHVEPWNGEGEQETMLVDLVDRSDPLWTRESNCDLGPEVCTFCPISGRLVQMAKMLPSELLAHVQSFLTPFDIFSLHLVRRLVSGRDLSTLKYRTDEQDHQERASCLSRAGAGSRKPEFIPGQRLRYAVLRCWNAPCLRR